MLTPEQSRLRIYENEVRELKKEKAELLEKLQLARKAMAHMLRELAKRAPWRDAGEMRKIADELEA